MGSATRLSADSIVQDVLERWPAAGPVLLRLRMACVGCDMAAFETLAEAAANYGTTAEAILARIEEALQDASSIDAARTPGKEARS
jgi:hybrid cluster-associated redox disulfide protein